MAPNNLVLTEPGDDRDLPTAASGSDTQNLSPDFLSPASIPEHTQRPNQHKAIPMPSSNRSTTSFHMSDDEPDDPNASSFDLLSPEVAQAEISIAPDGSYVETSSGAAAHALKRRYDEHIGVGKDNPSPFAITAFYNQYGRQMFRIGNRELVTAPKVKTMAEEERVAALSAKPAKSPHPPSSHHPSKVKRHSRLSVNALLSPLKGSGNVSNSAGVSTSRHNAGPTPPTSASAPKKLRKTRSIPDMLAMGSSASPSPSFGSSSQHLGHSNMPARGHSQSVTAADFPRYKHFTEPPQDGPPTLPMPSVNPKGGDMFGEVMQWPIASSYASSSSSDTSASAGASAADLSTSATTPQSRSTPSLPQDSSSSQAPSSLESAIERSLLPEPARYANPFGYGVSFDSPIVVTRAYGLEGETGDDEELDLDGDSDEGPLQPPTPSRLREMQSFESGLTARQSDEFHPSSRFLRHTSSTDSNGRPPSAIRLRPRSSLADLANDASEVEAAISASEYAEDRPNTPPTPPPKDYPSRPTSMAVSTADSVRDGDDPIAPPAPSHHKSESELEMSLETNLQSRYTTEIFDVLQTYRGLPMIDQLVANPRADVIRLSYGADETVQPRNDPRFVIWGEVGGDKPGNSPKDFEDSRLSRSNSSASASMSSSQHQGSGSRSRALSSVDGSEDDNRKRVLLAATIERWIAQLTSEFAYDELLNFFITYRTYVSAVDLCHLLICRFHWALQGSSDERDERIKRVVRVRTFVAIRFWLLTFFPVDFMPDRELRLLLANWLNTLIKDPILKKHSDGLPTVRKLKRVVKDCANLYIKQDRRRPPLAERTGSNNSGDGSNKAEQLFGQKFAEATRKLPGANFEDDSDLDLDFAPDEDGDGAAQVGPANAHLGKAHLGSGITPTSPSGGNIPLPSLAMLQQLDPPPEASVSAEASAGQPFVQTPATLPIHNNSLSKVFVKTMGRLGRWKRVLNSRPAVRAPLGACADVSAFDLELTVSRDLLTVNGGVEQYLKMIEQQPAAVPPMPPKLDAPSSSAGAAASSTAVGSSSTKGSIPSSPVKTTEPEPPLPPVPKTKTDPEAVANPEPEEQESPPEQAADVTGTAAPETPSEETPAEPPPGYAASISEQSTSSDTHPSTEQPSPKATEAKDADRTSMPNSIRSIRTSSTDSFGEPLPQGQLTSSFRRPSQPPPWQFDVVSIDDLDLSDASSEGDGSGPSAPPGLRKPPRKLPLRRDFEFVRRPESVSSMGIHGSAHESVASTSQTSSASTDNELPRDRDIQQWQMNALIDSLSITGSDDGNVEDALKRLEGQLNPDRQREKQSKVDGWVKAIRDRLATGDYEDELPRWLDEDSDDEHEENSSIGPDAADPETNGEKPVTSATATNETDGDVHEARTPIPSQIAPKASNGPGSASPPTAKPAPEDAVPFEILNSRMSQTLPDPNRLSVSRFVTSDGPKIHRSFILLYRTETLAQHFAMIDRELFIGVKFEELISPEWLTCEEVNVLDWAQFLKDRARWKAEHRFTDKTSALAAVRARFNLIANFVASEIILTPPSQRLPVFNKFTRLAFKSHQINNFNTLIAIMSGLRSHWVADAMKRYWQKIPSTESRMFTHLIELTNNRNDFYWIRKRIAAIAKASNEPQDVASVSGTESVGPAEGGRAGKGRSSERSCVPFIGVYLSQLRNLSHLPDLIDPTDPNQSIIIDPVTNNFGSTAHPEIFSALPALPVSMHLEPLINVQKQRLIAGVIRNLVTGQHLANSVGYPVDKKLFQKCLRLRGLDADTMRRALGLYDKQLRQGAGEGPRSTSSSAINHHERTLGLYEGMVYT